MRVRTKVCGITTCEALHAARESGADAVGFVFADSPRQIAKEDARALCSKVGPLMSVAAVFRHTNVKVIEDIVAVVRPDLIQTEPTEDVIHYIRQTGHALLPVLHDDGTADAQLDTLVAAGIPYRGVILEASGRGGRGRAPDWNVAVRIAHRTHLVLAGGLTPENVGEAIRHVRPYAVDVSSGVESEPGRKDPKLIEAFLHAVAHATTRQTTTNSGLR